MKKEKQKCKICEGEFVNLETHLRMKHQMSKEAYDNMPDDKIEIYREEIGVTDTDDVEDTSGVGVDSVLKEEEDIVEEAPLTPEEASKRIFGTEDEKKITKIDDLLSKFNISEEELYEVLERYKSGMPISVTQAMKEVNRLGKEEASKFVDKDTAEVYSVQAAEDLVKNHGFVVTSVTSNPKTWHLVKNV